MGGLVLMDRTPVLLTEEEHSKRNREGQLIDYRTKLVPRIRYGFMRLLLYFDETA
ncbi:unnamed protein product [Dovyalis caffra]|uniref:Uncharacterized protein n=1 Tax=Dovyalis caffra TaxID=77055 RepID=A0AAV1S6S8_9ROSI|nr:unnamed protein product [Dovyalis caffra]